MIVIDGSKGEGGGQILRSALALSLVTQKPFRIEQIRARRSRPGLLPQHLAAVEAAREISLAQVTGNFLGSNALEIHPGAVQPGEHKFDVGTAGSTTLVLQTVLPPLLCADAPSRVAITGGTHNPLAPPFDFVARSFVPLVERMGPQINLQLPRAGFYPAGAGRIDANIQPAKPLQRLEVPERGAVVERRARAVLSKLPSQIGERELSVVRAQLGWKEDECTIELLDNSLSPGNVLILEFICDHVTAVFAAFGQRGKPAEQVAEEAVRLATSWLRAKVPVDEHLADQLLLPIALAGGGIFRTMAPSGHTRTNADIIQMFLPVTIRFEAESDAAWTVRIT